MQLILNQKLISIGDKFQITDENNQMWFNASCSIFTLTKRTMLYDLQGRELYMVNKRYFRPFGRYDVSQNGQLVGIIRGQMHWPFVQRFFYRNPEMKNLLYIKSSYGYTTKVFKLDENGKYDKKTPEMVIKKKIKIRDYYVAEFDEKTFDPALAAMIGLFVDIRFHSSNNDKHLLTH